MFNCIEADAALHRTLHSQRFVNAFAVLDPKCPSLNDEQDVDDEDR